MKKFCALVALAISCALLSISASAQTVTPNAGLQVPAYASLNWQVPVIFDLTRIDNIFGGTVSVPSITLSGSITNANQAATKAYVDSVAQGFLQASGATMTGPLVLSGNPTAPLQAADKSYVDAAVAAGGGTGSLTASAIYTALGYTPLSSTTVPVPVYDWTHTAVLNYLNGVFSVDGNSQSSCTVSGTSYTTAFDCGLANARNYASNTTLDPNQTDATLLVGSNGVLATNLGAQLPTSTSTHATVNIVGSGINSSYLQLSSSLPSGTCMITQPDEATAGNSAYLHIEGLTLDLNGNADCAMSIDGVKSSIFRNIKAINTRTTAAGSGGFVFKFGGTTASGAVYEAFLENIITDGTAGGYTPAAISCATLTTAGNPVCTVSNGGSYPNGVGQVQTWGVGNGSGACSTYPTWSLTFNGTTLTAVTASGGVCIGQVYPVVTPPAVADNAFLFNSGFTDSTVKDVRAVVSTNFAAVKVLGHPNTFIHYHAYAGQPVGFEDHGNDVWQDTECDTLGGFCGAIEGPETLVYGTQEIFNNFTATQGSSLFYVDQSVTAPTFYANGVTCNGNRQTVGGYHSLVIGTGLPYSNTSATGGAVDTGYSIPSGVQMENVYDCSSQPTVNAFISHIGSTQLEGPVHLTPQNVSSATITGVNSPVLYQDGYSFNSGANTLVSWASGHADGPGYSNFYIQPPDNIGSTQYELKPPSNASSTTNYNSVPWLLDASVWHAGAALSSSLKCQIVAGTGTDPTVEARCSHGGADTGAFFVSFPHIGGPSYYAAPSAAAGAALGGSTISTSGNDTDFTVSFTTGATPATGALATMTFAKPWSTAPRCTTPTAKNAASAAVVPYLYLTETTTTISISTTTALAASTAYQFDLFCAQ
ncbi:MAG TPA: hypothetical protein VGM02_01445 [Acidobacteriaceae bacterium]|jgi:hypothetical protein